MLEADADANSHPILTVKGDFLLKNLQSDPRYPAFLEKMRLPIETVPDDRDRRL